MLKRLGMFLFVSGFLSLGAMELTSNLPMDLTSNLPMDPPTQETTRKYLEKQDKIDKTTLDLLLYDTINGQNHVEEVVNKRGAQLLAKKRPGFLVWPADILSVALCSRNGAVVETTIELAKKYRVELDFNEAKRNFSEHLLFNPKRDEKMIEIDNANLALLIASFPSKRK